MGSSSSKPMTSNEFDLLLKKNSTILSMQQKASDSAQASSANTLSITALQNAGDIPTLVTDAIQNNKDVMAAIGDSARKEISGNYVKQTTLDPLIQNVNGNIVIGSSGNGVILGSGSTPLPITAGNITAGDLAIGTLTATGDLKGKSLHITTNATIEGSLDSLSLHLKGGNLELEATGAQCTGGGIYASCGGVGSNLFTNQGSQLSSGSLHLKGGNLELEATGGQCTGGGIYASCGSGGTTLFTNRGSELRAASLQLEGGNLQLRGVGPPCTGGRITTHCGSRTTQVTSLTGPSCSYADNTCMTDQ